MAIHINTPIQYLKGVGPRLSDLLRKRQVETVGDLLEWYPRSYQDQRACCSIQSLEEDQHVSIVAHVLRVHSMNLGKSHRKMYEVVVTDGTGRIPCKFFRSPYKGYFERFVPHQKVRVTGKVTNYRGVKQFQHPTIEPIGEDEDVLDELLPLYTETEGLPPGRLRKIISVAIDKVIENPESPKKDLPKEFQHPFGVPDPLPPWLVSKYQLISRTKALRLIHNPPSDQGPQYLNFKSEAQKRIIFDEFFWFELHLAQKKMGMTREVAYPFQPKMELIQKILTSLPFALTGAQKKSLKEVIDDLTLPHPMHRLVQGDVGSGKTLVALLACACAIENSFQASIMVPTEILAEQHYINAKKIFEPLSFRVELLTGHMKASEKKKVYEDLSAGKIHICIGTHALIQEEVQFHQLGLVIIDEQHRFGVEQRLKLRRKGVSPHFLVMTATPIPRTLAMTVYGDLDISIIDEMPQGRQPIVTRKVFDNKRQKVMDFMVEQIQKGRQAYIVYPLVEESEKIDLKNAVDEFEKLKEAYPQVVFGLLHGKMKSAEKESIMNSFREGQIQALVSTTVIEVGVDVPNANMMIIEHAERFGLSQLHQLRGRVGRGSFKSYCVLILGYAVSDESRLRAEIMEKTSDGFKVSEADLEIRGPGQFIGTKQSGLPGFKMANLVRDIQLLKLAREAAFELIQRDPQLEKKENEILKQIFKIHQEKIVG